MRRTWLISALLILPTPPVLAQHDCPGRGTRRTPGFWEAGPAIRCGRERRQAAWRLFTPPRRATVKRPGYRPGRVWILPRSWIRYRCTGSWLQPVVVHDAKFLGFVLDLGQLRCRDLR